MLLMLTNLSHLSQSGEFNHVFMLSENVENTNSTDTAGGDRDEGAGAGGGEPAETKVHTFLFLIVLYSSLLP